MKRGFSSDWLSEASRAAHRWIGFAAGLPCLVTGCVQGPNYSPPHVAVPSAYRFATPILNTQPASANGAWWHELGDRHLNSLVQEALENNRDLRIATARVDEFSAILAGTKAQGFPQIGYDLNASRSRASEEKIPGFINPLSSSFGALLSASWEIDLWGRIRRDTEAARANLLATEEGRRGVVLTLISSVIIGYVTLLDLDERLRVAEATVEGRRQSVELFRARLNRGYISDFEMTQAEAEYESTLAAIPDLKQAIATQENALSVLVGRNPGPIVREQDLAALRLPKIPGGLPSDLITRRPDILQAEQQLIASNALIGVARALYFPRISLTTIAGFASSALGSLFTGPARTWSFTGDVAGPIFTGGGIKAANRQSEARRDQSLFAYENVVQNAFRDVDDSLAGVRHTDELEQTLDRRVQSLQEGVRLANLRYENGYSDYLDVLDTERGLFSAQLSLTQAQGDRYRALVGLYRALGGDWVQVPASAGP
jgi:multidrug efflux system outer membrane protein